VIDPDLRALLDRQVILTATDWAVAGDACVHVRLLADVFNDLNRLAAAEDGGGPQVGLG
jgi:hypothetical protein